MVDLLFLFHEYLVNMIQRIASQLSCSRNPPQNLESRDFKRQNRFFSVLLAVNKIQKSLQASLHDFFILLTFVSKN